MIPTLRDYAKHTNDCPQAYDEKWINILHHEQHLDDDAMEDCHFAACRAWCVSKNPPCTCGLEALLRAAPVAGETPPRCEKCNDSGYVHDGDGIEDNCDCGALERIAKSAGADTPRLRALVEQLRKGDSAEVRRMTISARFGYFRALDDVLKIVGGEAAVPAPHPQEPRWQPIESAPKDGTKILLFSPQSPCPPPHETILAICRWRLAGGGNLIQWPDYWEGWPNEDFPPTHWMPLPASPDAGSERK